MIQPQQHVRDRIDERRDIAIAEGANLRSYLATGEASFLAGPPAPQIPYFDSGRLRYLLDTPEIRAALPPEMTGRPPTYPWVEAVKRAVLRSGLLCLGLGAVLLAIVVASGDPTASKAAAASATNPRRRADEFS